jgi:potassium-transporting ATPase KdpC subunit
MKTLIVSLKILVFFIVLTGIIYPVLVTIPAQVIFPYKANGGLLVVNNKITGSKLIGQRFDSAVYFSSRPSAISYNPLPSGGSNYSLTSEKLKDLVEQRKQQFIASNQLDSLSAVPPEMLFASASGLDPHISPKAAMLQANRIAEARNFSHDKKQKLIECIQECTEEPQFLLLGEERINVLLLNLRVDKIR